MTTDREMLEAAAKAAGVELRFLGEVTPFSDGPERIGEWNPLTDDGDAFRLAVKLGIEVMDYWQYGRGGAYLRTGPALEFWEAGPDPYAATRRAVVRAAAAMAKE